MTIAELVERSDKLDILRDSLKQTELLAALNDPTAAVTVFAPVDRAWQKLPDGVVGELMRDTAKLRAALLKHVLRGAVEPTQLVTEGAMTLANSPIEAGIIDRQLVVNGAIVLKMKRLSNGIVYLIDSVI
jgi:uncharacterized surface protein with fasciclin (FAS1) repeats